MPATSSDRPVLWSTLSLSLLAGLAVGAGNAQADSLQVVELTQTPCQFVEVEEGGDHGFSSQSKADCDAINAESGAERLAKAKVLELEPGSYVFRVSNKNVPYDLGFWLREKSYDEANAIKKLTMTSVSGGGLKTGVTKDYEVQLEPGEYIYSCPLNPTPNYRIIVKG